MSRRPGPPRLPARLVRWLLSRRDADRLLDALDDEYVHHQRLDRGRLGADLWYWRQALRSVPALRRRGGRERLRLDLLHLSRRLRRAPVSAGAAILTLSLTLGPGTAIFAVVDAVLLRPPPFADPHELVTLGATAVDDPAGAPRPVGYATFEAWRERARPLAALAGYDPTNATLTELGPAERVSVSDVTPGFLALLGVTPVMGRLFEGDDVDRSVAIVSHAFWRERLAADPAAVGRRIVLDGRPHTVVGVLPKAFFFALNACDVWRPLPLAPAGAAGTAEAAELAEAAEEGPPVRVVARLGRTTTRAELAAALDDVSLASSPRARVLATPVAAAIAGDSGATLAMLAGAAALAMVIAFINLAVLLFMRAMGRRRELAVRRALGSAPSETARQLVLEAVGLVALGILGGALLAVWITPVVGRFALEFGGLAHRELGVSWRAVGAMGAVATCCAAVCGLLPALGAGRERIVDALRRGVTASGGELTVRRGFVAGEVALAFVLLLSMALLGRSLLGMLATDPGFDARGVLKHQVSLPSAGYPTRERAAEFYARLQGAIQDRLGPGAVSLVDEVPLTGDGGRSRVGPRPSEAPLEAVVRSVAPGYFDVMRIPVVAGRSFDGADDDGVPPRVVITGSLARQLFGSEPPIGRSVWADATDGTAEVVGVVGDVKHRTLEEAPLPTLYLSALQSPSASAILVVRSERPEATVIATVREEVARLDPNVPVYRIESMRDVVAQSPGVPARRLLTAAFAGFALLAVILGAIGLFGVTAHDVASRRHELALRMALGADPKRILAATLAKGVLLVGSGLVVGGALSVLAVRGLGAVLVTTGPSRVLVTGAAVAVMLLAVGAAAILPAAMSAARGDPLAALRSE